MSRIEIENFGPIKHVAFNVNDYTVFIGPQASGKSTIARLVFFFLSLESTFGHLFFNKDGLFAQPTIERWKEKIIEKFNQYCDDSLKQNGSRISFFIDDTKNFSLHIGKGLSKVSMSESLELMLNRGIEMLTSQCKLTDASNDPLMKFGFLAMLRDFVSKILSENPAHYEYIPAGRTIFSVLHNELTPESIVSDIFVKKFISGTNYIRRELIKRSIEDRFDDLQNLSSEQSKNMEIAKKIYQYTYRILLGKYLNENSVDFIYTDSDKKIPLLSASSGQQESLWILYHILFYEIMENQSTLFAIIEEPESHLFPEGQRNMMHALTLFANHSKNQLMLTTHSPYILTPLSNLLYAFTLGQDESKRKNISKIIDPDLWIDPKRFECYYVDNGMMESMVDRETNMINLDKLDMASTYGNEELDKLLELER